MFFLNANKKHYNQIIIYMMVSKKLLFVVNKTVYMEGSHFVPPSGKIMVKTVINLFVLGEEIKLLAAAMATFVDT